MKIQLAAVLIVCTTLLSACHEDEMYPAANFSSTGFVPGFKWKLDASASVSLSGQQLQYRWNVDFDQSQFDTPWSTNPVYMPVKDHPIPVVTLQVKDENGFISELSREILSNSFMYYFWHDTIRSNDLKIPFSRFRNFKNSKSNGGDWMMQNIKLPQNANTTNTADSALNGSYITWDVAQSLHLVNYFHIPMKDDWLVLIEHFHGHELAGFNFQVKNTYGLALGLHGYIDNNQILDNKNKGYYWTGTEVDAQHAWALEISNTTDSAKFIALPKTYQCKVRLARPNLY